MGQQQSCCSKPTPSAKRDKNRHDDGTSETIVTIDARDIRRTDEEDEEAEAERELLNDIVPWSPWKVAVVALKRKQNDRSELGECTSDLNVDESPFSYLFQVGELLRSTFIPPILPRLNTRCLPETADGWAVFQVGELLRSTTKQLGEDPESPDFRRGMRSLAKQPAGCRLLGVVAPLIEREVLEDTLSQHLLPLPGSRERWLAHVR